MRYTVPYNQETRPRPRSRPRPYHTEKCLLSRATARNCARPIPSRPLPAMPAEMPQCPPESHDKPAKKRVISRQKYDRASPGQTRAKVHANSPKVAVKDHHQRPHNRKGRSANGRLWTTIDAITRHNERISVPKGKSPETMLRCQQHAKPPNRAGPVDAKEQMPGVSATL